MKDKIDKIIETVLENVVIDGLCNTCSDNDSGIVIVDDNKNIHQPVSDYDRCREAIEKILRSD